MSAEVQRALAGALQSDVPPLAIAFHARWWQLETWLRELAYLEVRAAYGRAWLTHLVSEASEREEKDAINRYMATPDAANTLAYLGSGYLFDLIESKKHWSLFQPSLPPRKRWQGMADGLKQLRNRNAHCRRPHADDLVRLEQTLRDFEPGLWRALESYNADFEPRPKLDDPVVAAWVRREHIDAVCLVNHARAQYDVDFSLTYSRRPPSASSTRSGSGRTRGRKTRRWPHSASTALSAAAGPGVLRLAREYLPDVTTFCACKR
jgi:hypothetical protein